MDQDKDSFNKMILLTGVKIFGIIFSFAIPMYLGRKLSVESYGTYKQIMLFFWFAQVALNLGLDDSAYFFLRRDLKKFPLFSFNALIFNLIATGLLWLGMSVYQVEIANAIKNPDLSHYLPLLGYLILTTISSMQLEGILINLNRFKERLALEMGMELLKSLAIVLAFVLFDSVYAVLVLLSILMTFRLLGTIWIIHQYKRKEDLIYRDAYSYFWPQIKFGFPLGISRIFQNLLNIENFLISSFFSLTQFTIYSVGCFENPLINAARGSLFELVNIEMVDAMKNDDYQKAIEVWRRMTRKLFLIVVPFVVYMMFFGKEIITFIFSDKYLESVPFFIVFNLYLFVGAINPEPIFRATQKTHMAFKIKIFGVIVAVGMVMAAAYWGGPMPALVAKIAGMFIINCIGLVIGAKLLRAKFKDLFQWKELIGVTFVSLVLSALLKMVFIKVTWHPFWILALSFSLYVCFHFIASWWMRLIKDDEIDHLKSTINKLILKLRITNQ